MSKMKNILLVAFFAVASMGFVQAQEELSSGAITMEMTDISSDNEQMAAQLEMMKGSQTEYLFSDSYSLSKSSMMGGMINMSFHVTNETEDMVMLFDMMGNKMMIESTKEEREGLSGDQLEAMKELVVTYDENDTKEILGYKCVKAVVKHPEMTDKMSFEMYVTEEVKASPKMIQGLSEIEIKGFPLMYMMKSNEPSFSMTYEVVDIKKEISDDAFELKTGGYTKMTMEEFQESMGAMGGGFGF